MKTRFKEKVEQAIGHAMSHTKPYDWDNVFIDAVSKITAYHQDDINELKVKFKELVRIMAEYDFERIKKNSFNNDMGSI